MTPDEAATLLVELFVSLPFIMIGVVLLVAWLHWRDL